MPVPPRRDPVDQFSLLCRAAGGSGSGQLTCLKATAYHSSSALAKGV